MGMLRAVAAVGRLLRGIAALATLAGFTAGAPWLLARVAGWPLDWIGWPHPGELPGLHDLLAAITTTWSDDKLFGLLATLGWALWALLCRDLAIEAIDAAGAVAAARSGHVRPPATRTRGPVRWVAAVLVGALLSALLLNAARGALTTPTSRAATVARTQAVAVAPAHPGHQSADTTRAGSRPAVAVAADRATTIPVTATHPSQDGIPPWARNAPGGVHPVVEGDNLWDIAATKLGNPHRWREIYLLNRGHRQANGYALTDPDIIDVGWVLALPARDPHHPLAAAQPDSPPNASPRDQPAPTIHQTAPVRPSTAPSPSTPATPAPGTSQPEAPSHSESAQAAPAPDHRDATRHSGHQAGVRLPPGGWVSLGLAATIATVAAQLRLQRRRRARLTFPIPVRTGPQPAPVPDSLTTVDTAGTRHLHPDNPPSHVPRPAAVPVPVGVNGHGNELSLFHLPGAGLALLGDGAVPAARAILASVLATGATDPGHTRPVVVTTEALLAQLLPGGVPPVGLDPHGITFDGERLHVLPDTAAAVTRTEEEMIHRRRLLDTFHTDTVADLDTRPGHAEQQPPYVLLIAGEQRYAARVVAVAAHRTALHIHPVILGVLDGIPGIQIDTDGTATTLDGTPRGRLATLGTADLADLLAMLTQAAPRPEPGTDPDDPPSEPTETPAGEAVSDVEIPIRNIDQPAPVRLHLLGPVTIDTDAGPVTTGMRSGSYAVLALLAAHPQGRTLEQMVDDLYRDIDPDPATKRVRVDITTARRVLRNATGQPQQMFIVYDQPTGRYRLDPDTIVVDLWQMLAAIQRANTAPDDTTALAALQDAVGLYQGEFADGQDRAWIADYATTYRHQILSAYARIAEILEADQPDQAISALEHAIGIDPVNEELYQRIMRIHGRLHRPDAVRATLRQLETRLAELGAEPSEATRRLARRQLQPTTALEVRR